MSSIEFEYEGTTYTLEYDRESAKLAESRYDISLDSLNTFSLSRFENLFAGALIKHHPRMKTSTMQHLFDVIDDKQDLYPELGLMYAETLNTLFGEEDASGEAKVGWKKV